MSEEGMVTERELAAGDKSKDGRFSLLINALFGISWCGLLLYPLFDGDSFIALHRGESLVKGATSFSVPSLNTLFEYGVGAVEQSVGLRGVLFLKIVTYLLQYLILFLIAKQDGEVPNFTASLLAFLGVTGLYSTSPFGADVLANLSLSLLFFLARKRTGVGAIVFVFSALYLQGKCLTTLLGYRVEVGGEIFAPAVLTLLAALALGLRLEGGWRVPLAAVTGWLVYALAPFLIPFAVSETAKSFKDPKRLQLVDGVEALRRRLAALPTLGTVWLLGCVILVNYLNLLRGEPLSHALFPRSLVDLLLAEPSQGSKRWGEIVAPPDLGSYLRYRGLLSVVDGESERSEPRRALAVTRWLNQGEFKEQKEPPTLIIVRLKHRLYESLKSSAEFTLLPVTRDDGTWRAFARIIPESPPEQPLSNPGVAE